MVEDIAQWKVLAWCSSPSPVIFRHVIFWVWRYRPVTPSLERWEQDDQPHPQLCIRLEANLAYMTCFLKQQANKIHSASVAAKDP